MFSYELADSARVFEGELPRDPLNRLTNFKGHVVAWSFGDRPEVLRSRDGEFELEVPGLERNVPALIGLLMIERPCIESGENGRNQVSRRLSSSASPISMSSVRGHGPTRSVRRRSRFQLFPNGLTRARVRSRSSSLARRCRSSRFASNEGSVDFSAVRSGHQPR